MGFLQFLKTKEKEGFKFPSKEELDIPPAPKTGKIGEESKPVFPAVAEEKEEVNPIERFEKESMKIEKDELSEREDLELHKPIFVKNDLFKSMMDEIGVVGNTLKESEQIISRVGEFKSDEDKEFEKWRSQILDVQRKLIYAEKTLFS